MALPTARALVDDFLEEQHAAEEFAELFEAYDTDSSGSIESDEFLALARDFLPALLGQETWDTLRDAFARADASRTGWLDKGEFVALCASVFPPRVLHQKGRLHLRTQLDLLRLFKMYLLRQIFLLILSPSRSTDLFGGTGTMPMGVASSSSRSSSG